MTSEVRRCAVYTRKSSEEGLEQAFNSLHAQREACEAYIRSQAHEGWKLVKTAYDDGGFSGGTMERPALKRLMADLEQGLVDVVVVYKVDRLTRSLADFAKIVEILDGQGASFVSITQQFNTTIDGAANPERAAVVCPVRARGHGRAHSRQDRGLQAQGHVDGRQPAAGLRRPKSATGDQRGEAETVRYIFRRTWNSGPLSALQAELSRQDIVSKVWTRVAAGRRVGWATVGGALLPAAQCTLCAAASPTAGQHTTASIRRSCHRSYGTKCR